MEEPWPSGVSGMQLGFSLSLDTVVLVRPPSQTRSLSRGSQSWYHRVINDDEGLLSAAFNDGSLNYSASVRGLSYALFSPPFPEEKYPSSPEIKQNRRKI